ncbi:fluoride efflux transporter FluC [Halomonas icarae]|uniref:Fluoride-specific ion channel FluC n=1 Tax=Halomonas icarae TaxID=2691040 RepID=A0A7X5ALG1_9GAMM|nr:CrcB family protein [Halomonas icarae]MDR5902489.1 CrcB family protein [Halomonas icarae]NAW13382.1 camphor resistance protein CrcB [Halomonas icarae]
MLDALSVLMGGALGGMLRLALGDAVAGKLGSRLPWGTLVVNLSGALTMGLLVGWLGFPAEGSPSGAWALLGTGLLGGYTTVSSLSLQTLSLWQQGQGAVAMGYMAATLVMGLAALVLGAWLAGGLA